MNATIWALISAFIWGIVPIIEKMGLGKVEPFTALFFRCIGVILGLFALSVFIVKPDQVKAVDPKSIILLVIAGFLASFVAQITFYHALKLGEVSKIVPIAGSYYLISFLLGVVFLGETITPVKLLGVLFMVSGIWLLK